MGLEIYKYKTPPFWSNQETGEICEGRRKPQSDGNWILYEDKNPDWKAKPRIDHRHHAMDAITVACVEWWMIKNMSNTEKLYERYCN